MNDSFNDRIPRSLNDLTERLAHLENIDRKDIPALLAQLSALQSSVAARLFEPPDSAVGESNDRLLTIQEAAERLRVTPDWLYRRTNSLPFVVRLGRQVRFSNHGIQKYLKRRVGSK